ncbi:MAG: NADH:flavin oxidoreductase/NADH oxidase family protein [Ahniella sp.]|nr:NADH:flavin oxidoreductase/NADH oxidase family protein [Ahniella sp.]
MTVLIDSPFVLPCGQKLRNRIVKAAMTEGVADGLNRATHRHAILYRHWAATGAGVLLTGNVMVDHDVLERPGNIVIDGRHPHTYDREARAQLATFSAAARSGGGEAWMQISHAGRQSPRYVTRTPRAPSPVSVDLLGLYAQPVALHIDELPELVQRFAFAAEIARDTGFTGVQVHSAHGYLLSSFLSPHANRRDDAYGGPIENRARLLIEILRATRQRVGADFAISVKLNSDDFRKGGFSQQDCLAVVAMLNQEGIDCLEISGGTYEQPRLLGFEGKPGSVVAVRESTRSREAYFLAYAEELRKVAAMPIMVTGGFRTRAGMNEALADDACDLVGVARPFMTASSSVRSMLEGQLDELPSPERQQFLRAKGIWSPTSPFLLGRMLNVMGAVGWSYHQILRRADGLSPQPERGLVRSFIQHWLREFSAAWQMHRVRRRQTARQ